MKAYRDGKEKLKDDDLYIEPKIGIAARSRLWLLNWENLTATGKTLAEAIAAMEKETRKLVFLTQHCPRNMTTDQFRAHHSIAYNTWSIDA